MCRWLAYTGSPIRLEELIFKTPHSLIDQSMSAQLGPNPTNGDGFGVGWYGRDGEPGVYRGTHPAWNDANLRDMTHHVESSLFLAHVRRATGTPVQQSNCHPFRHGQWLFVHNGLVYGYERIRRDLALTIDPALFPEIRGSADSELLFHVALSYGLAKDPVGALERMVGRVEELGREAEIEHPLQMTIGVSDGETLYAARYSSVGDSRTLFYTSDASELRAIYPDHPILSQVSDDSRAVASEPTSDLTGIWNPVPESTVLVIGRGEVELRPFTPRAP